MASYFSKSESQNLKAKDVMYKLASLFILSRQLSVQEVDTFLCHNYVSKNKVLDVHLLTQIC